MACCELCKGDMLKVSGCAVSKIHVSGKVHERIPVGGHGDFLAGGKRCDRCGDCNAMLGEYHHWGCDNERCPVCGMQLISCDCEDVFASPNPR